MSKAAVLRHNNPLEHDIETSSGRLRMGSITGKRKSRSDESSHDDGVIDARSSRKILALAQDLAEEDTSERNATAKVVHSNKAFEFGSRFLGSEDEDDIDTRYQKDQEEEEEEEEGEKWMPEEEAVDEDIDPAELALFKKFLPEGNEFADFAPSIANLFTTGARTVPEDSEESQEEEGQTTDLTALILQKIAEKEARDATLARGEPITIMGGGIPEDAVEIPAKVVDTFTKVGQILSRYKSGPLPKPFKVLPTLPQWPELLEITQPNNWTPNALYKATKIFISANASTGQHFLNTVLLDRVREDIQETKKLNVHLYNSLKASFYRASSFFKGFLFPLVESGCTLREAHIIGSVLAKIKIPVLHSAAALLRLCEISAEQTSSVNSEAAGSANIFIRTLLAKKYALPYKVVDGLVFHFLRFRATQDGFGNNGEGLASKESKLPVLWHQSLLVFAQTYRNEITEDQREALLDLLLVRGHKDIGPEVRRELLAGRNRGVEQSSDMVVEGKDDGDDTMDIM